MIELDKPTIKFCEFYNIAIQLEYENYDHFKYKELSYYKKKIYIQNI